MSTINVSNLNDGTKTVATTNLTNGSAKAWVTYDHQNATVKESYSISSITDISSGRGTVNLTNAMTSSYHCSTGSAGDASQSAARDLMLNDGLGSTSSTVRWNCENHSNTVSDAEYVAIKTVGDLA